MSLPRSSALFVRWASRPAVLAARPARSRIRCNATVADKKPDSADTQFWSDTCRPMVDALLKHSETYSSQEQEAQLRFLDEAIIPNIGPRPSANYRGTSLLTSDGTPFRPSWNFSGDGTATLRLAYDPVAPGLGTAADPFGQNFLRQSMPAFAGAANPKADMTWYEEVMEALYLTPEEEAKLHASWPKGVPRPPYNFFAYGCKGMKRDFKPYFHPFLKVQATGKSSPQVIYEAIRSVTTLKDGLAPAISLVKQYTDARSDVFVPHLIGGDCIEPAKARLKIYGIASSNAFNFIEDIMTLGGKMTDAETMRGVEMFREIYPLLINEKATVDPARSKEPRNLITAHRGTGHSFEMRPGRELPEPKVYLPIWQFAETEQENLTAMQTIFRRFGWNDAADRYALALQEAFPKVSLDGPTGTHAWVSFSYTDKTGPYMTVYLAPRIQEAYEAGVAQSAQEEGPAWHPVVQDESGMNQDYPKRSATNQA